MTLASPKVIQTIKATEDEALAWLTEQKRLRELRKK